MSDEKTAPQETQPKRKLTREEKQAAHVQRITRTTVACLLGLVAWVGSFLLTGASEAQGLEALGSTGILLLAVAIAVQKFLFPLLKADPPALAGKDWVFQGFMTGAGRNDRGAHGRLCAGDRQDGESDVCVRADRQRRAKLRDRERTVETATGPRRAVTVAECRAALDGRRVGAGAGAEAEAR